MGFDKRTRTSPLVLTMAIALIVFSGVAQADSKKWRANNHTDQTVKVFFTAAGCGGVKPSCDTNQSVGLTCKSHQLGPGEETEYEFNAGTSDEEKVVCSLDANQNYSTTTHDRKRNGIRLDADGLVQWYHD